MTDLSPTEREALQEFQAGDDDLCPCGVDFGNCLYRRGIACEKSKAADAPFTSFLGHRVQFKDLREKCGDEPWVCIPLNTSKADCLHCGHPGGGGKGWVFPASVTDYSLPRPCPHCNGELARGPNPSIEGLADLMESCGVEVPPTGSTPFDAAAGSGED